MPAYPYQQVQYHGRVQQPPPPPQPPQYVTQTQQKHSPDPNFKYCSFCNNRDPTDKVKFTHWVKDKDTQEVTCPFLKANLCYGCYEYGHTKGNCPNTMKVFNLEMMAALPFEPPADRDGMSVDDWEKEQQHFDNIIKHQEELIRRQAQRVFSRYRHCEYCEYNYPDEQDSHYKGVCPRLAMVKCPHCKESGHTVRFCPVKKQSEIKREFPDESEWELDFSDESDSDVHMD